MKCDEQIVKLFEDNLFKVSTKYITYTGRLVISLEIGDNEYCIAVGDYDSVMIKHWSLYGKDGWFTKQWRDYDTEHIKISKSLRKRIKTIERLVLKKEKLIANAATKRKLKEWGVCK